jgi:hypothetical protein
MSHIIEFHIDEFVLHGFDTRDTEGIKKAVESELSRLIAEQGLPSGLMSPKRIRQVNAGRISTVRNASAGFLGKEIAGSVFGGLKNQNRTSSR